MHAARDSSKRHYDIAVLKTHVMEQQARTCHDVNVCTRLSEHIPYRVSTSVTITPTLQFTSILTSKNYVRGYVLLNHDYPWLNCEVIIWAILRLSKTVYLVQSFHASRGAAWTDSHIKGCNPPSENPGYGPAL